MHYTPTIGLEIHIELKTKSKMFCSCLNNPNERQPNINICPVCMGHPGTLPVISQEAVVKTIKTGLALNCQVPEYSKFDRKNYFYPDLPKGYQISQYDAPLTERGFLEIGERKIRIRRVHLEEDTGKLFHPEGVGYSLVDFNRAGLPLMELVTEPDLHSAKEARVFAQELRLILRYLEVSDADMEKGQMRVEANISLQRKSKIQNSKLGTKVEIKNLNSFRSLEKAIDYEINRQTKILKAGKKVAQETRGWHDKKEITFSQREKEASHDYRYFPEPDLPVLRVGTSEFLNKIKVQIPELPRERRERFKREYKLSKEQLGPLIKDRQLADYFEGAASELAEEKLIKSAANYILKIKDNYQKITAENFAELITLIDKGELSSSGADIVLKEMQRRGGDPSHLIEEKKLRQTSDLQGAAQKVIRENIQAVKDYKAGKKQALQFLVGQMMAQTKGRANPQQAKKFLTKLLA